jgi:3-methyladenine DNA glycosylase AlkD
MEFQDVMKELELMGTAQNRKIYARHGSKKQMFGVSFANLKKLTKKIKKNHTLALKLWESDNMDAMMLATMVLKPERLSHEEIHLWIKQCDYYPLADSLAKEVIYPHPDSQFFIDEWVNSPEEWEARVAWLLIAIQAKDDLPKDDKYFTTLIPIILEQIHSRKNRTKEAMNYALIAIGIRNENLRQLALKAADTIGKVEIDHGETSCKTPLAREYIEKAVKHYANTKKSQKRNN